MKLSRAIGRVTSARAVAPDLQIVETEHGPAINYPALTGTVADGATVVLNRTARLLNLGTGGYDFVMAIVDADDVANGADAPGHIMKARYTPAQHAVLTLEEQEQYADIWTKPLDGFPVLVGQLHSQLAPAAAALSFRGYRVAYVMTDAAALMIAFSRSVTAALDLGYIAATITTGQASGGQYETVTVASALLAAKYIVECDAAVVVQGPGNAGTGTKYGFSGLEQANQLDTVAALGGVPIAIARVSEGDQRERHQGMSHHTATSLSLVRDSCRVPLPPTADASSVPPRHAVHFVPGGETVVDRMQADGFALSTMGRSAAQDGIFFEAAAAAGIFAADLLASATDGGTG